MDSLPQITTSRKLPSGHHPHYVYALAYPDGRIFYVGKGHGKRMHMHEQEARRPGNGSNPHKIFTIRKIWDEGGKIIKTKLASFRTHEEAVAYEIALIFFLPNLTNLTSGGEGAIFISEETREKMSIAAKHPKSEEMKRKLSETNRGHVISEETRKKISATNTGNIHHSEEARRKMSEASKEHKWTEEQRQKFIKSRTGQPVKPFSDEYKRKLSTAQKTSPRAAEARRKVHKLNTGKKRSEGTRRKMSEAMKTSPRAIQQRSRLREARRK